MHFRPSGRPHPVANRIKNMGQNKGHDVVNLQYSCVSVGCHLRRNVVEIAASHEAVNRRVVGSSPT